MKTQTIARHHDPYVMVSDLPAEGFDDYEIVDAANRRWWLDYEEQPSGWDLDICRLYHNSPCNDDYAFTVNQVPKRSGWPRGAYWAVEARPVWS